MDQLAQLIGKLTQQFQQNAGSDQLLLTLKQLEAVLQSGQPVARKSLGTAKVAVVLPATAVAGEPPKAVEPIAAAGIPPKVSPRESQPSPTVDFYDPIAEIPTLAHQKPAREMNEAMATATASLNDTLKSGVVEVGHILKEAPVRDLKKAIGINDRFVFIKELFRGDETAYDSSIRTLNGFRIFAEAEYWMERELKVKLGWDMDQDIVRHFYFLVRRRFS